MKIVVIKWRDAAGITGWRGKKEMKRIIKSDLELCITVGLLQHESKKKVVIVHTSGSNQVSGVFEIPKGCIESMKVVGSV